MNEYVPSSNRAYYYRAFKNCKNTTECAMRFMWCPTDRKHTQLQIHHIDGDITNNEPENLLCMCVECHATIHGVLCNFIKSNPAHIQ